MGGKAYQISLYSTLQPQLVVKNLPLQWLYQEYQQRRPTVHDCGNILETQRRYLLAAHTSAIDNNCVCSCANFKKVKPKGEVTVWSTSGYNICATEHSTSGEVQK